VASIYTTTASVDYAQTAYDRLAYFAYRPELYYDRAVEVQPTRQSMPGSTVVFTIQNDLPIASTQLNESTDVSAVGMSDSQVSIALAEYGNATITTAKLRGEAFVEIDPIQANVIGYNAGVSIDEIAKNIVQAGTNVDYSQTTVSGGTQPTSRSSITPGCTFSAANVRLEKARLRRANVPTFGGAYVAYMHPDVAYDLMGQTGSNTWTDPHTYSQPDEIWQGEIGMFQGVRFIETPRAPWFGNAGSSPTTTSVYGTLFLGRQAIAKAYSIVDGNGANPHIVPGPVTDLLRRFLPLGWYHLVGYGVFRQAALRRVESSSSIDDGSDTGQDNSVVYTATATNGTTTLTFTATQATYLQSITSAGQVVQVSGAGITGNGVIIQSINDGTGVVTVYAEPGSTIGTLTATAYTFSWTENQ
jgi:N4-gp56 family major capsid protein